ncbi:MAG: DUF2802 domain-containing protein [Rhodocyclaceae bacterium]|nr:DUF2802 domain-containing protein [Rhodocyclaceae bacterium]
MGAREFIWALIALVALYVGFQFLRLGRRRAAAPTITAPPPAAEAAPPAEAMVPAEIRARVDDVEAELGAERDRTELELQQLRRDVAQLRAEQEALRRDHQRLSDQLDQLGDSVATVQAGQHVSPQYGEAVMLARRGLESEAIAERCGISVAEAALVRSLAGTGDGDAQRGGTHGE